MKVGRILAIAFVCLLTVLSARPLPKPSFGKNAKEAKIIEFVPATDLGKASLLKHSDKFSYLHDSSSAMSPIDKAFSIETSVSAISKSGKAALQCKK